MTKSLKNSIQTGDGEWRRPSAAGRADARDLDPDGPVEVASPPCYLHELDPSYLGFFDQDELLSLLNELLEAERAGARGVGKIGRRADRPHLRSALQNIARHEARFCAMLSRHIDRLGGAPSPRTGAFYDRLLAADSESAQLALLNRGQGWVVRKLRESLPRIEDRALRGDLMEMLDVHVHNIKRCDGLTG